MLKISAGGKGGGFCDGIARRDFIRIGAMGIGGMTTANLLEAEHLGQRLRVHGVGLAP